jgi:DNA-binding CsgD family transcriptional regulator
VQPPTTLASGRRILRAMATEFCSGDALFTFECDLTVVSWNRGAEELTGIGASDAVGKQCWEVVGGVDERGSLVCHAGCSGARLAGQGWPVRCQRLLVKTGRGLRKAVWLSTIAVRNGDEPLYMHLMRNGPEPSIDSDDEPAKPVGPEPRLTDRQLEVLELMRDGLWAKAISRRLRIAEPTVRNHIRAILLELSCHSQLEALAQARRWGLIL